MHINNGDVHIHDDANSHKFISPCKIFKKDAQEAIDALSRRSEGVSKIKGTTGTILYLLRDGKDYHMFLSGSSMKTELKKFIKDC